MKRVVLTQLIGCLFLIGITPLESQAEVGENSTNATYKLVCPDDVHLTCGADLGDLNQYGQAYIYGCGTPYPAPPPHVEYNTSPCGTGYIKRTWTVMLCCGNYHSCSQYIHVYGKSFDSDNIIWPADYMTDECDPQLRPQHLPDSFNFPVFVDVECGNPLFSYNDRVFKKGDSGCKKIIRDWTVIDCYTYNPNSPDQKGRWEHTQIIKVKIMEEPEINCPDEIIANTDLFSCDGAEVDFPAVEGTGACGEDLKVTNDYPWAVSDTDASGFYPLGTTVVTFTAKDDCGNVGTCKTEVTVKDQIPPTPVCHHGISSTLKEHVDGYYLDLEPKWFDRNSFDNCTPNSELTFEVSPERVFCDDLPEVEVKLTVTDESGNSNYCITYLKITDNKGLCGPDSLIAGGTISSTLGGQLAGLVFVSLKDGNDEVVAKTVSNGDEFRFEELPSRDYLKVIPSTNDNPQNNITTFDLLLLHMYIAGLWAPESPSQLLAADVDMSGTIDVMDLAHMRNVILGRVDNFPGGDAWRFYDANHSFNDRQNPHHDNLPGLIELFDFEDHTMGINFNAVKLGCLSCPDQSDADAGSENRSMTEQAFSVNITSSDDVQPIILSPVENSSIYGLQFAWPLGKNNELLEINSERIPESALHYQVDEQNNLRVSVANTAKIDIKKGEPVLEIVLVENPITWSSKILDNQIYSNLAESDKLVFEVLESETGGYLVQRGFSVFPNPANGILNIELPEIDAGENSARAEVYDLNGRLVMSRSFDIHGQGGELLQMDIESLSAGMYLMRVNTGSFNDALRFIKTAN
ncbi:MAG: T9SS C-terminal target domain-containing protein [Saprospirales bacterium]|nr:MAG: T9SS C-terminal target domain-containing protein [Saprospirales bacterium]